MGKYVNRVSDQEQAFAMARVYYEAKTSQGGLEVAGVLKTDSMVILLSIG